MPAPLGGPSVGYRHVAHVTSADASAVAQVLPVLAAGLERGDPLVLACSDELAQLLRAGLPADAPVAVVSDEVLDGRTPTALAGYTALLDQHAPASGHRLQLVTDSTRHCAGMTAWLQTEALLNHVLADRALDHLCVVDEGSLGDDAALARATHRLLLRDNRVVDNPAWREPAEILRELGDAGADPAEETSPTLVFQDVTDMRALRRGLNQALRGGPLPADDTEDLVLAIDEVTANAGEHGVPPVDVRLWVGPEQVLCTVSDRGPGFEEPLAGYGPAHGTDLSVGGMGLWLARRAVDRMTTGPRSDDGGGCVVRLSIDPRTR
ncbi:ATP-binding protein [Modestobacter sp. Leaf380]|uniref:ATP-binding protein n=1 Tax=Modestobacter sp. Leaf380 TaxID=1736356 RepID=UPI00138EE0F6|nr:ATP-binding protein [Modestobacter sp. Leaf380]